MKYRWNPNRREFVSSMGVAVSGFLLYAGLPAYARTGPTRRVLGEDEVKVFGSGVIAPEGPTVLPNGDVAMVEFSQGTVVVLDRSGDKRILAHVGNGVAGTIMGNDGALYVAKSDLGAFMRNMPPPGDGARPPGSMPPPGNGGPPPEPPEGGLPIDDTPSAIWRIDLETEEAEVLYEEEQGEPLAGPNDLTKDRWGDLWVSQPAGASVLNLRTDGSHVETVLTGVRGVNGITLSPDKTELYLMSGTDLMAYEIVARGQLAMDGAAPRGRIVLNWPSDLASPDGMKTQANGNILCACRDDGVVEVTPQGKLVSQTAIEGQQVINVAFSPLQDNVLLLAVHPADSRTGSLLQIDWPDNGVF